MSVNDKQVGGAHYRGELQHWDVCELHGIGYLESAATKYIQRRKDNKLQDLEKALHYTEKLIELNANERRYPRGSVPQRIINRFCEQFSLNKWEKLALMQLFRWRDAIDLHTAVDAIHELIRQERAKASQEVAQGA